MTKIVVNRCWGGFGLSDAALLMIADLKGVELEQRESRYGRTNFKDWYIKGTDTFYGDHQFERDDPDLIQVVEELGEEADGENARLEIVEIPDDVEWTIDNYDGRESVKERHMSW